MMETGFVERAPGRLYRVGAEFSRLGALAAQKLNIAHLARPMMERLVAECNETCLLGLYLPKARKLALVEKIDSRYPLRYMANMYVHRNLVWGATGLSILAWLPDDQQEELLAAAPPSPANASRVLDVAAVRKRLELIRERGYAITSCERVQGAVGIAAPVFRAQAQVAGNLCLTIPTFRFEAHDEKRLAELLIAAARTLSRSLGHAQA